MAGFSYIAYLSTILKPNPTVNNQLKNLALNDRIFYYTLENIIVQ